MFRKIAKFRGDSAFSTWVHRIAVNTVLDALPQKALGHVSLDEPRCDSDGAKVRREYGTRDKRLSGCVYRVALTRAMKQLPPVTERFSCFTRLRAMSTRKSPRCSVVP